MHSCNAMLALGISVALITPTSAIAEGATASEILAKAFHSRYDADITSEIELTMRDRSGREHRRVFEAASKMIDGKLHSMGKLNWPNYLRDMTILTIEVGERNHDAFVYLPSLDRIRRISSAQRGDAFFGTDITYEDLERRHADEFRIDIFEDAVINGEATHRIQATPIKKMTYTKVDYFIAQSDMAFLEMRFYRGDSKKREGRPRSEYSAPVRGARHPACGQIGHRGAGPACGP